ncbi:hypothetical protein BYT27DRAFT_6649420, partial [Phlegmacium glaucopus]
MKFQWMVITYFPESDRNKFSHVDVWKIAMVQRDTKQAVLELVVLERGLNVMFRTTSGQDEASARVTFWWIEAFGRVVKKATQRVEHKRTDLIQNRRIWWTLLAMN